MRTNTALILVDPQNDFCPGGSLAVPEGDTIMPALNRAIEIAAVSGWPVFVSRDWHPSETVHFSDFGGPWPRHCEQGTKGAEFHEDLSLPSDAIVISKGMNPTDDGYSAFEGFAEDGTPLADALRSRGVTRIVVGGLATEYCDRATVLSGIAEGFEVLLLEDGVKGIDITPGDVDAALKEMRAAGATMIRSEDLASVDSVYS